MKNRRKIRFWQCVISLFVLCMAATSVFGQSNSTYDRAMELYEQESYKKSAQEYDKLYKTYSFQLSTSELYNGACIYALNNEFKKAFEILEYLVTFGSYTNFEHLTTDTDLENLHKHPQWEKIIDLVKINNLPMQEKAERELLKAKRILEDDAGKLWGTSIWDDHILVLSSNNTAYSLTPFAGSEVSESGIYTAMLPAGKLYYVNTTQEYDGKRYATVMDSYLSDNSATIIHELFHVLQMKHRMLYGQAINYLDNYDAREWLRLEFQALRNCLNSIIQNKKLKTVSDYLQDAMIYRKIRQTEYSNFLVRETEIETLEGLANYTGFVLCTYPNKYELAIKEINQRERTDSYIRTFSYATGFAYGVIFDYLKIDWKQGLDAAHNFLDIYEKKYLKHSLNVTQQMQANANERSNYVNIHKEETARKEQNERKITLLRQQLIESPTLSVDLTVPNFAQSYDMNGTVVIDSLNVVYTTFFQGTDISQGKNFGSFTFSSQNKKHEITGILKTMGATSTTFIFPLPFQIENNKIIGDTYEITLNDNWSVERKNEKGDFEIIKKKE